MATLKFKPKPKETKLKEREELKKAKRVNMIQVTMNKNGTKLNQEKIVKQIVTTPGSRLPLSNLHTSKYPKQ